VHQAQRYGAGKSVRDGRLRRRGARRTAGDDRFDIDDRVGQRGAVERLAGYFERREEEGRCHLHFTKEVVGMLSADGLIIEGASASTVYPMIDRSITALICL
jgi:hypothetical protein